MHDHEVVAGRVLRGTAGVDALYGSSVALMQSGGAMAQLARLYNVSEHPTPPEEEYERQQAWDDVIGAELRPDMARKARKEEI